MEKNKAIEILKKCVRVLELVETRVQEVENEGVLDYSAARSVMNGATSHINVAYERIRTALGWQRSADETSHK